MIVRYVPDPANVRPPLETSASPKPVPQRAPRSVHDPAQELIRALDQAESLPGLEFIGLKHFRNHLLARQPYAWASSSEERDHALREAINRNWVLTDKLANPLRPQYRTTAVRLNRSHPEVQAILGQKAAPGWDFKPVPVRGEPVSESMLRERS